MRKFVEAGNLYLKKFQLFLYKCGDKLILKEFKFDWIKFREMLTEDMNDVVAINIIIL